MRSTVEILDSLDRELRKRAADLGLSFKEALNRAVAAGLPALESSPSPKRRYRVKAKTCGVRPGVDLLHLNRLVDELEDSERAARR